MLTNYCGEEGPNCVLKGAVVCSNPFNLDVSSKILQNSYIGREVYLRVMGSESLANTIPRWNAC
jgi:predicted alpha/beta-fold hydrolase